MVDKAIELNPNFAEAYINRGLVKKALKDHKGAKEYLQTALKLAEQRGNRPLIAASPLTRTNNPGAVRRPTLPPPAPEINKFIYNPIFSPYPIPMKTPKAFITYSHENKVEKETLEKHLQSISDLLTWNDKELVPGDEWRSVIREELGNSDILLYLASKASINSKSCNEELSAALRTKKAEKIRIIPIILEDCEWKEKEIGSGESISPPHLSNFIALPEGGKPITEWKNPDEAWKSVTIGICRTVEKISKEKTTPETSPEELLIERANFARLVRQPYGAITLYNAITKLNPNYAAAYNNRGIIYRQKGEHKKAIADFNKSIEINTDYTEAYNNRGNAYYNGGEPERAIADYSRAIALNPNYAVAYNNRGIIYRRIGEYKKAFSDYNKAIELDPNYTKAYNNRGLVYQTIGEYEKSIADFNQAIELNPNFAEPFVNRGVVYGIRKKSHLAIADFNTAIKIKPNLAEAYGNRALVYCNKEEFELCIFDSNKAIELKPNYAQAYNTLGIAYSRRSEFDKAITNYNKAIELGLNYAEAYINRGTTKIMSRDYEGAREDLQTALKLVELQGKKAAATHIRSLITGIPADTDSS